MADLTVSANVDSLLSAADYAAMRILLLQGQSLTGSEATSLLDMTSTWNTTGTPTALKLNVTDTASNASSLLMDLQVGGSSKFKVDKFGAIILGPSITTDWVSNGIRIGNRYGAPSIQNGTAIMNFGTDGGLNIGGTSASYQINADVRLYRDAAGIFAQRNSTNAQESRIYNTYTDASNGEWLEMGFQDTTNTAVIKTNANGTGTKRNIYIDTTNVRVGTNAGRVATGSNWNTIGYNAGYSNATGGDWNAVGTNAGYSNTNGGYWNAIGNNAGYSNATGSYWNAIGVNAGYSNTSGISWTAYGYAAGYSNTTGSNWNAIGFNAGRYLSDGTTAATGFDNSNYIGVNTKVSANGVTNENVFGYNAIGSGSNTVTIGNSNITKNVFNGAITLTGYVKSGTYTVATLPAAATAGAGATAFVSDGSVVHAGNSGSVVAGSGANFVPVYSDGTDWRIT